MKLLKNFLLRYGFILFILAFATIEFFLILRHKSPYLSDSYFYKHIFYEFQRDNFSESRTKVLTQINLEKSDEITKNIFLNEEQYKSSYQFFVKRPLYPFMAFLVDQLIPISEYWLFLLPVFAAYVVSIILVYALSVKGLGYTFGLISSVFFIGFYPYLDWSTYFLTDTIGFFFWLLQIFFIYKFLQSGKISNLINYTFLLIFSLFNREQSMLMLALLFISFILSFSLRDQKATIRLLTLLIITFWIDLMYILISRFLKLPTILDTIIYTQNSYGLFQTKYSANQILAYLLDAIKRSHIAFLRDLVRHHWWFVVFSLGIVGILRTITARKKNLLDILIFSSGIASYLSIFIYPVLSYRFFFPVLFAVVYFAGKFISYYLQSYEKYIISKR